MKNPILYVLRQMEKQNPALLKNVGVGGSGLLRDDFLSADNDLDLIFIRGLL